MMELKQPIECCPHCNGKGGFTTNIRYKANRLTGWDGEDVDTDNFIVVSETSPACVDCGKSVKKLMKEKP